MAASQDERYQEWLERLEIPIEDAGTKEELKTMLEKELGFATDSQVEALWETSHKEQSWEAIGIVPVLVNYPWGRELRYGIQGLPGLWGYESAREVAEESLE